MLNLYNKIRRSILPASKQDLAWTQDTVLGHHKLLQERLDDILYGKEGGISYKLQYELSDIRYLLLNDRIEKHDIVLVTNHPVAVESNDHLFPRGTSSDNTRSPRFCRAVEKYFNRRVSYLDLGCSGGGLVFDFLLRGHFALGLEGSDFSFKNQRAEWRVIPKHLFTCDICFPFQLFDQSSRSVKTFDVISMWEVLEHIPEDKLSVLFSNVCLHLDPSGLFVGSIALIDDIVDGVSYHPSLYPREWWRRKFFENGLEFVDETIFEFGDFCRGAGNGARDQDFSINPELGFHFVAKRRI